MRDLILAEAGAGGVALFLDFHSTDRTIIYAPPLDAPSPRIDWLRFLRLRLEKTIDPPPAWNYAHNSTGGTSKGWALSQFAAPGITVELADTASASQAQAIGATIAIALADYLALQHIRTNQPTKPAAVTLPAPRLPAAQGSALFGSEPPWKDPCP
jgi:hypothetical protein